MPSCLICNNTIVDTFKWTLGAGIRTDEKRKILKSLKCNMNKIL